VGQTDGTQTEVQGKGLNEGMKVVTGLQPLNHTPSVATNPFTPKLSGRPGGTR
jgi:hypothetical protein